jgi:hypothetical protein
MAREIDKPPDATAGLSRNTGPWESALATLREWDPEWADICARMTANPCVGFPVKDTVYK